MSSPPEKDKPGEMENDKSSTNSLSLENYPDFQQLLEVWYTSMIEKKKHDNSSRKRSSRKYSPRSSSSESSGSFKSCSETSGRYSLSSNSISRKSRRSRRRIRRRTQSSEDDTKVKIEIDTKPNIKIEVKKEVDKLLEKSLEKEKINADETQESASNRDIEDVTIINAFDKNAKIGEVIVIDSSDEGDASDDIIFIEKIFPKPIKRKSCNVVGRKSYRSHVVRQRIEKTMMNNQEAKKHGSCKESSNSTKSASETTTAKMNDDRNKLNNIAGDASMRIIFDNSMLKVNQILESADISTSGPNIDAGNLPSETPTDLSSNLGKNSTIQAISTETNNDSGVADNVVSMEINNPHLENNGNNAAKDISKSLPDENKSKSNQQTTSGKIPQPKNIANTDVPIAKEKTKQNNENNNEGSKKTNSKPKVVSSKLLRKAISANSNQISRNVESRSSDNIGKEKERSGLPANKNIGKEQGSSGLPANKDVAKKDLLEKTTQKKAVPSKTEDSSVQCTQQIVKIEESHNGNDSKEGIVQKRRTRVECRHPDCNLIFCDKYSARLHYQRMHIGIEVRCKGCRKFFENDYRAGKHACESEK